MERCCFVCQLKETNEKPLSQCSACKDALYCSVFVFYYFFSPFFFIETLKVNTRSKTGRHTNLCVVLSKRPKKRDTPKRFFFSFASIFNKIAKMNKKRLRKKVRTLFVFLEEFV